MAKANTAPTGAKLTKTANAVDTLLLQAGTAYASVTSLTTQAAKLASKELDEAVDLKTRLSLVMAAHGVALVTAGHNVKAIFAAALALYAMPDVKVDVPTFDAAGKKTNVTRKVPAAEAATMAKHTLIDAAKQVRVAAGINRDVEAKVEPKPAAVKESDDILCTRVLSELADALKVKGFAERLIRLLDVAGYVCAPKANLGKMVKAPAPKATTMADLPKVMVQGSATV